MGLVVVGVLLVVGSAAAFFYMQRTKAERQALIGTETLSIPELKRLRGISDELRARGEWRAVRGFVRVVIERLFY
jgi:hypothetical protein